jgi:excisionase family DNA binding protein
VRPGDVVSTQGAPPPVPGGVLSPETEKLYTEGEVAQFLRLDRRTVRRLREAGLLRGIQITVRRVRIPASALADFMRSREEAS